MAMCLFHQHVQVARDPAENSRETKGHESDKLPLAIRDREIPGKSLTTIFYRLYISLYVYYLIVY